MNIFITTTELKMNFFLKFNLKMFSKKIEKNPFIYNYSYHLQSFFPSISN